MRIAFLIVAVVAYLLLSISYFGFGWSQVQALSVFAICGIMGFYLAAWLVITWIVVSVLGGEI